MVWNMLTRILQNIKQWFGGLTHLSVRPEIDVAVLRSGLILLAITLLSYLMVDLFYKGIRMGSADGAVAKKHYGLDQGLAQVPVSSPIQNYGIITDRNLFLSTLKVSGDKPSDGALFSSSQEVTAFDLKGTVAVDSSFGFIIVEERGKNKQKLYRIGEMVGSAKLVSITRNTAILSSGGREITMKVKATADGLLLSQGSRSSAGALPPGISISKQEITESLGDLKSIMSQAVVRPYINAGVQEGFIVSNIIPNSLYQRLGLRDGDIIVNVNQKNLTSADDVLQLVGLMQAGGHVTVNIKRNGKDETINYSFQ